MKARAVLASFAVTALVACQQGPTAEQMAEQGVEPLSGSEIRNTVIGNTLYTTGTSSDGTRWQWAGHYMKGGKARGRAWWNGGQNEGKGAWRIDGNLLCSKWGPEDWGEGGENCQRFYKDGKKITYIVVEGPDDNGTVTLKEGNPHDL